MAVLTNIKFSRDNKDYEVSIDFDGQAILQNQITFNVIAEVTDSEGIPHAETLQVVIDWERQVGQVLYEDTELYQFSLGELDVRMNRDEEVIPGMDGNSELNDKVFDKFEKGLGEAVGDIIDSMPVPDPFLGCLIKASISSLVGQAITCQEMRFNYGQNRSKVQQILRCLGQHVEGIAFRTLWRASRCIIRFGF